MRAELAGAVAALFAGVDPQREPRELSHVESERLVDLAALGVRCRSAVERDGRDREIELIPEPEAPGRLALVLARLLGGLDVIGVDRIRAWEVIAKVALDSMPALRRKVLEILLNGLGPMETSSIALAAGYPTTTTRRSLQDLAAHGVVERCIQGLGLTRFAGQPDYAA